MAKKKTKFICQSCGYESPKWMGRCPGCNGWNTMTEEVEITASKNQRRTAFAHTDQPMSKPVSIMTVGTEQEPRVMTDSRELNRVLGAASFQGHYC